MIRKVYSVLRYHFSLAKIADFRMRRMIKKRPLDINIETTNVCPLKCVFCCNRLYQRQIQVMTVDHFEYIINQYVGFGGGALGIGGQQSDFLSDKLLLQRISCLEKNQEKLWIYSTTPLISARRYSDEELIRVLKVFSYLEVSVAGWDRDSYIQMVGIDGFDILYQQLTRLYNLIQREQLKVKIELSYRTNDMTKLKSSDFYREMEVMFPSRTFKDHFFSWFGSIKQDHLPKGAILVVQNNEDKKDNCDKPNTTLSIMSNGKVVGCGCIDWLQKYVVGDTHNDTLLSIWRSNEAIKFKNAFKLRKVPSICEECALYCPCGFYNKKFLKYTPLKGLWYMH